MDMLHIDIQVGLVLKSNMDEKLDIYIKILDSQLYTWPTLTVPYTIIQRKF
jgi:hypothetical protein